MHETPKITDPLFRFYYFVSIFLAPKKPPLTWRELWCVAWLLSDRIRRWRCGRIGWRRIETSYSNRAQVERSMGQETTTVSAKKIKTEEAPLSSTPGECRHWQLQPIYPEERTLHGRTRWLQSVEAVISWRPWSHCSKLASEWRQAGWNRKGYFSGQERKSNQVYLGIFDLPILFSKVLSLLRQNILLCSRAMTSNRELNRW